MKKFLSLIGLFFLVNSCDDGDIVVTDFSLDDSDLSVCGLEEKVIFATNNQDVHESLSLVLSGRDIDGNSVLNTDFSNRLIDQPGEYQFKLSSNNRLIYRVYDSSISSDYFCSSIPPSSPKVQQEYVSGTDGIVTISVLYNDLSPENDADGDGIPNEKEGYKANVPDNELQDTDGDGIPDYLDIDDDGDNVLTRNEINPEEGNWEDFGFKNTDADKEGENPIPDYLDTDDDGDDVLTRNEVDASDLENLEEGDYLRPSNYQNAGFPNYLDDRITESGENPTYITNTIERKIRISIEVSNFVLKSSDGEKADLRNATTIKIGTYPERFEVTISRNEPTNTEEENN